jgi:hypothetical protein
VSPDFEHFLQSLIRSKKTFNATDLFEQGGVHLEQQLRHYLSNEGVAANTFAKSINSAQKLNNEDTSKRFWEALKVFNAIAGNHAICTNKILNKKWLRFVNIIEDLQGYSGSQLFSDVGVKKARLYRLYFAYMLTWEHLRYMAGADDEFSPSSIILETFAAGYEHEHEHEHCHEHG